MTHDQLQTFVSAVNDALPASMELCIETVDNPAGVVHFRLDRQDGVPSAIQLSFGTVRGLHKQGGAAAAWYMRKMFS